MRLSIGTGVGPVRVSKTVYQTKRTKRSNFRHMTPSLWLLLILCLAIEYIIAVSMWGQFNVIACALAGVIIPPVGVVLVSPAAITAMILDHLLRKLGNN